MNIAQIDMDDNEDERREVEAFFRYSEAELRSPDFDGKLKPLLETVFLRVFDSENDFRLLIALLNALLRLEGRDRIEAIEKLSTQVYSDRAGDKDPVLDMLVRDQSDRHIQVELQLLGQEAYMNRAIYYASQVHSKQLLQGELYDSVGRTVTIHVLAWNLLRPRREWSQAVTRVKLCDILSGRSVSEQLQLLFIELPKFKLKLDELSSDDEKWIYYLKHGETLTRQEVQAMGIPELKETDEKLRFVSRKDDMRFAGIYELKRHHDAINFREGWKKHGFEKGIQEGLQQGLQEGLQQGLEQGLQQGLQQGIEKGLEQGLQQGIEKGLQQGLEQGLQQGLEQGLQQGLEQGLQQGIEKGLEQGLQQGLQQGLERGLQQGIEKGVEKGIEVGRREGEQAGALNAQRQSLLLLLEARFGALPTSVLERVQTMSDVKQLGMLFADGLKAPSLEALGLA